LEGINGEQLAFIKRLCYVVPNPPIDLVAVGNPTLLIEVKTTACDADEITVDVFGRYLEKARSTYPPDGFGDAFEPSSNHPTPSKLYGESTSTRYCFFQNLLNDGFAMFSGPSTLIVWLTPLHTYLTPFSGLNVLFKGLK
jgi:hypothetical protein